MEKTLFYHSKIESGKNRVTLCGIIKDTTLNIGAARCGKKDNFSKKKGRSIAEGRALKNPFGIILCDTEQHAKEEFLNRAPAIAERISITKKVH